MAGRPPAPNAGRSSANSESAPNRRPTHALPRPLRLYRALVRTSAISAAITARRPKRSPSTAASLKPWNGLSAPIWTPAPPITSPPIAVQPSMNAPRAVTERPRAVTERCDILPPARNGPEGSISGLLGRGLPCARDPIAPILFCAVQRGVGVLHDLFPAAPAAVRRQLRDTAAQGHAAAGRTRCRGPLLADPLDHAPREGVRAGEVGLRQQQEQLVAAVAVEAIGRAQVVPQRAREPAQHLVPGSVAAAVVVLLEVVDVEERDAVAAAVALRRGVRMREIDLERAAVADAEQPVLERERAHTLERALELRRAHRDGGFERVALLAQRAHVAAQQIRLGQDPDEPPAGVDDRQSAEPAAARQLGGRFEIRVGADGHGIGRHHVARAQPVELRPAAQAAEDPHEVALADDPHRPLVARDYDARDAPVAHHAHDAVQACLGRYVVHVVRHQGRERGRFHGPAYSAERVAGLRWNASVLEVRREPALDVLDGAAGAARVVP